MFSEGNQREVGELTKEQMGWPDGAMGLQANDRISWH